MNKNDLKPASVFAEFATGARAIISKQKSTIQVMSSSASQPPRAWRTARQSSFRVTWIWYATNSWM